MNSKYERQYFDGAYFDWSFVDIMEIGDCCEKTFEECLKDDFTEEDLEECRDLFCDYARKGAQNRNKRITCRRKRDAKDTYLITRIE